MGKAIKTNFTIRLSKSTHKDLKLLAKSLQTTKSAALRRLLYYGFSSMGNWRRSAKRQLFS